MQKIKNVLSFSISSRIAFILAAEIIVGIILAIVSLLLFFKLGNDVFQKQVFAADITITNYIYQFRNPLLNTAMIYVSFLGSSLFLFCASVVAIGYFLTKRRKDALIFSVILYSGVIINMLLKEMFQRPRPHFSPLVLENSYSFPSAHAMNAFVFYTAISYFILRATKNLKLTMIATSIMAFVILIIGVSRVYLGAHYPSDVLAGYIGGFFYLLATIIFEKTIIFERLYKSVKKKS